MKLSIVMPVYNEGDLIGETIKRVEESVITPHELLICYDMDEDTTVAPVKKLQKIVLILFLRAGRISIFGP